MIAIQTRFFGPTNHRGSRYKAYTMEPEPRSVIVSADHSLGLEENHKAAARKLITKLGWATDPYGKWVCGGSTEGYVFVCDNGREWEHLVFEPNGGKP